MDLNRFRVLRVLAKGDLDFVELESVIKSDPALCHRLLRFMKSPAFYLQFEIRSILHALMVLGEIETRKWLLLVCSVIFGMRENKAHLLTTALVRARFAELIAQEAQLSGPSSFILGLLSLMDAILDLPISLIAEQVAVSSEIGAALNGVPSPLRRCLDLVLAYEAAEWSRCEEIRKAWRIPAETLSDAYLEAVQWASLVSDN